MPALVVANCVQSTMRYNFSGIACANVLHFSYSGAGNDVTDLEAFSDAITGLWQARIMPLLNEDVTLVDVKSVDLQDATAPVAITVSNTDGGVTSAAQSSAVACVVSLGTARRYRGGHGRVYLPAISQAELASPKEFTTGFTGNVLTGALNVLGSINAYSNTAYGVFKWVVLHSRFVDHSVAPTVPPTYLAPFMDVVTGISVDTRVDTQRRRLGA